MNMVSVPFRGGGEAITALLNGSTPVLFSGGVNFPPLIRDGKIVGLVVDSPKRPPLFPQVPTLAEVGYPEKLNRNYVGLVVPAATPGAVIDRIYGEINAIMNNPTFRQQQLIDRAVEPIADTPLEFARFLDMSIKSANETEGDLLTARDLALFSLDEWEKFTAETIEIRKMTYGYRKKLLASDQE